MHFVIQIITLLTISSVVHAAAYIKPRALRKANQYPRENCTNTDNTNRPTFYNSPIYSCVTMNPNSAAVFIATSLDQKMIAFTSSACQAGAHAENVLGNIGGKCRPLDTEFDAGRVESLLYHVPIICGVAEFLEGLADDGKKIVMGIINGLSKEAAMAAAGA